MRMRMNKDIQQTTCRECGSEGLRTVNLGAHESAVICVLKCSACGDLAYYLDPIGDVVQQFKDKRQGLQAIMSLYAHDITNARYEMDKIRKRVQEQHHADRL